jgi:hypothetical protein
MKKLKDPKILIAAGVIVIAIIIFVMIMSGAYPSGGHGHAH